MTLRLNGETNQLLTMMLHGIAGIMKETRASNAENAMVLINLNKALRMLLQEHGTPVPTLQELAMMDEATLHFENEGEGITDEEALRIAVDVMENDCIWDEVYTLMQDIHEEI